MGIPELLATYQRRAMLSAAAACVLGATIAGYMDDQQTAARMLASKVELPKATLLQSFDGSRHMNMLRETRVIGEVNLNNAATVNLGDADNPRWVELVPVYAVSADGAPLAKGRILAERGLERRPMPRGLRDTVAADGTPQPISHELMLARVPTIERAPALAVLARSVAPEGESFTSLASIGAVQVGGGANGALVELSGALLSEGSALATAARVTLGGMGQGLIEGGVFFAPVPEMRAAPATILYERLFDTLVIFALFFIALAVAPVRRKRVRRLVQNTPDYIEAAGKLPSIQFFQPIRGQDDLEREALETANKDSAPEMIARQFNRVCEAAAHHARRLKSLL